MLYRVVTTVVTTYLVEGREADHAVNSARINALGLGTRRNVLQVTQTSTETVERVDDLALTPQTVTPREEVGGER